jgi:hypothetical protein
VTDLVSFKAALDAMQYSHQRNAGEFPTMFSQLLSVNSDGVQCRLYLTHFYSECFQFVFIAVNATFIVRGIKEFIYLKLKK